MKPNEENLTLAVFTLNKLANGLHGSLHGTRPFYWHDCKRVPCATAKIELERIEPNGKKN